METIKCDCGHLNSEGTVLCGACGNPIEKNQHMEGNDKRELLNMRYDGIPRRSLTYNKTLIDKIWRFFSSVKTGVWLIVLVLFASLIGTILPQESYIPQQAASRNPAVYYQSEFGLFGWVYYQLGFHQLYSSWWYMTLIGLLGVSLIIASLDRFVPLFKALRNQKIKRHERFLRGQRLFSKTKEPLNQVELEQVAKQLKKNHYKVKIEDNHLFAEKGRFSRWGPYVNHIGLILILIAALLRTTSFMYMDEYVWIREGETLLIPGTGGSYYIENEEFSIKNHQEARFAEAIAKEGDSIPSSYETKVTVYQNRGASIPGARPLLEPLTEETIRMNEPLNVNAYTLYQSGYQLNEFTTITFNLYRDQTPIDTFTIDLSSPKSEYVLDSGHRIAVDNYYPDYVLNSNGIPVSETNDPRNPAFVFSIYSEESDQGEANFIALDGNLTASAENTYEIAIEDASLRDVSGLAVKMDRTLPLFAVGAVVFMIGVVQGMYWQHRRIWIHPKEGSILLASHTNKNWFGMKKDIEKAIDNTSIQMAADQQESDIK